MEDVRPSGYRRDSRIELIFEGDPGRTIDGLEGELRACLRQTPEKKGRSRLNPGMSPC